MRRLKQLVEVVLQKALTQHERLADQHMDSVHYIYKSVDTADKNSCRSMRASIS